MTKLSVNLNKIAVLRNARGGGLPSFIDAANVVIAAGADGLTVHPRPDQRHIQPRDVAALAQWLATANRGRGQRERLEFNIEGNPFAAATASGYPGLIALVASARPDQVTLVPDSDGQITSDHGFDLRQDGARLRPLIAELQALGARVSLFMDADSADLERARELGADRIELYTGPYAEAFAHGDFAQRLQQCAEATARAQAVGLGVNAGHDLDQANLPVLLRAAPGIAEVSIGHALINDALYAGLASTVTAYLAARGLRTEDLGST